ncbi:MAG: PIG-L family deacetylase [Ignavibacteria bacterium]|jgi:LmbE family N-acetylglucosaminyl deacetylase
MSSSEIQLGLQKLKVLGSVLYIAAHPDDENTAVISYLSKGKKFRTAYLSLTRGDGGQNLIGSEKGDLIGVIRTHELLEARKVDGGEQFFSRAVDFGYSKFTEETLNHWNKEEVLSDVIYTIREFKPDVIITRFPVDSIKTHGHHTASAVLALAAFNKAGDPDVFPEQLKYVDTWQPKRIFWNDWRPNFVKNFNPEGLAKLAIGEYNYLLGESYNEIYAKSRSKHKSQGFGARGFRGEYYEYFTLLGGDSPTSDGPFEGIETTWSRIKGGSEIESLIEKAEKKFEPDKPYLTVPLLVDIYKKINNLKDKYWRGVKKKEAKELIRACCGLWFEIIAKDYSATANEEIKFSIETVNRSDLNIKLAELLYPFNNNKSLEINLEQNTVFSLEDSVMVPGDTKITNPFWLEKKHNGKLFNITKQNLVNRSESQPSLSAKFYFIIENEKIDFESPLLFRSVDRVDGELYRYFEIRPEVTANLDEEVYLFAGGEKKNITVRLKNNSHKASGKVMLKVNNGWGVSPEFIEFNLTKKYEEKKVVFEITPPKNESVNYFEVEIETGDRILNRSLVEINHEHIPIRTIFPVAEAKLVRLEINKAISSVGYIEGSGDEIPGNLEQLGYDVTMLDDDFIENEDLSGFDAIVTGVRAYNTRERIKFYNDKLLDYVKNGGTLLVQYNTTSGLQTDEIGPYPFNIGRDRVTYEDAPVNILNKDHPLLNYPNKITRKDFENWIQERGIYFAEDWDQKYETVFSCNDPGEVTTEGGLIYCKYGNGIFIYTGFSWFRQLSGGVPGAYCIFTNLISGGKYIEKTERQ